MSQCAIPDTAARGVAVALCLAEAPYQILFSTPGWRDLFGQRATLRCLEGVEQSTDQLAGLLEALRHGFAVRAPLCSFDRNGLVLPPHMTSAAPIFSAAGDVVSPHAPAHSLTSSI